MKKILLIFLALCTIFLYSCTIEDYELYRKDNVEYMINQKKQIGFISNQYWECDLDNTSIYIADEVENCKITSFGGYFGLGAPAGFCISFIYDHPDKTNLSYFAEEKLPKDCEKVEVPFRIYLNKYLEKVDLVWPLSKNYFIFNDSPNKAYYITYYFICPEENKVFHSKDGKLYYKSTNELVKEFYEIN